MPKPQIIVIQDKKIQEIIGHYGPGGAISRLYEQYRISGANKDEFVAALIGRLCLLEQKVYECTKNNLPMAAKSTAEVGQNAIKRYL
jgi:hypothetical protein